MKRLALAAGGLAAAVIAAGSLVGYNALTASATVTANVWLSPTGNDSTATRSASPVGVQNPARTWSRACQLATGGDVIGVQPGTYPEEVPAQAATNIESDCSDGLGNAVDPTTLPAGTSPASAISKWVTFSCADETRDSVILDVKYFTFIANVAAADNVFSKTELLQVNVFINTDDTHAAALIAAIIDLFDASLTVLDTLRLV